MKLQKKTRAVVAAMMAITLAVPSAAFAGGGHHKGYSGGHSYGHSGKHGGYGHNRGYGGHYGKHVTKYKYDNDNDGEKLLIGLLVGGLVGYAISDSRNNAIQHEHAAPVAAPPREGYSTTQYSYSSTEGACLQEREYQNKIIIGGRSVDAYGTACLQPDGSWRYGPARTTSF